MEDSLTQFEDEQHFRRWLAEAQAGAERPYPDAIEELVSQAAALHFVARGWNNRVGRYAVRLHHKLGEGLPNEPGESET